MKTKEKTYISAFFIWAYVFVFALAVSAYVHWEPGIFVSGAILICMFAAGLTIESDRRNESYSRIAQIHQIIHQMPFETKEQWKERDGMWDHFTTLVRHHLNHWPNDRRDDMPTFCLHYSWQCDRW